MTLYLWNAIVSLLNGRFSSNLRHFLQERMKTIPTSIKTLSFLFNIAWKWCRFELFFFLIDSAVEGETVKWLNFQVDFLRNPNPDHISKELPLGKFPDRWNLKSWCSLGWTNIFFFFPIRENIFKLLSLKMGVLRRFSGVFWWKTPCRCMSLLKDMHFYKRYIMPTVLWTYSTFKHVTFSRQRAGVPLLSLKMGVLRPFWGVFWYKTHCRCRSLLNAMHVSRCYIMPTVLWNCSTFKRAI